MTNTEFDSALDYLILADMDSRKKALAGLKHCTALGMFVFCCLISSNCNSLALSPSGAIEQWFATIDIAASAVDPIDCLAMDIVKNCCLLDCTVCEFHVNVAVLFCTSWLCIIFTNERPM